MLLPAQPASRLDVTYADAATVDSNSRNAAALRQKQWPERHVVKFPCARRTQRGFESQRRQAERLEMAKTKLARRDELQNLTMAIRRANEKRKQERHDMQIRLSEAKIERFGGARKPMAAAA